LRIKSAEAIQLLEIADDARIRIQRAKAGVAPISQDTDYMPQFELPDWPRASSPLSGDCGITDTGVDEVICYRREPFDFKIFGDDT
jgi:hypothetical protein